MLLTSFKQIGVKLSDLWGRGSNSEGEKRPTPERKPPELDKLWTRFNDRLNRLFRKKGSGGGSSPSTRGIGIAGVFLVLFLIASWMTTGIFVVGEGQVGMVMTFGKHTDTRQTGMNWRWPFPVQSFELVNVGQVRKVEVGFRTHEKYKQTKESLMVTGDLGILDIQAIVQFKVKNASDWAFNNANHEAMIRQVAESALREVVGRSKTESVRDGKDKIALEASQNMQVVLDKYASGAEVVNLTVQAVQPPEQVQAAFDEAEKAAQERNKLATQGKAYADDILPKAKGVAARLIQDAEGYRARVVANAEGDTTRFNLVLAEYQKAPVVTRDRMYIETMQQIYTSTTKVLVDSKSGGGVIYLPLDKLISQNAASDAQKAAPSTAPAATAPATTPATAPATAPASTTTPATTPATTTAPASSAAAASASASVPSSRSRESRNREPR